jgi:hypothetical protein
MPAGELATLAPLTNELIIAALEARDYQHFTDDDGDIGGWWDENLIYFFRFGQEGELLQVRTRTRRAFTVEEVTRLYEFCNSWNHDRFWPKAYVHVADDGTAQVYGEVITDLEAGISPEQLDQLLECGIATGCQLSEAVDEL